MCCIRQAAWNSNQRGAWFHIRGAKGSATEPDFAAHLAVHDGFRHSKHDGLADSAAVGRSVLAQLRQVVVKHLCVSCG